MPSLTQVLLKLLGLLFVAVALLPLLLAVSCASFTSNKISDMKMIRGTKPGASFETEIVSDKGRKWKQHMVAFDDATIDQCDGRCLSLERNTWRKYQVGDEIEVVYLPGCNFPHHKDAASRGHFFLDYTFLAIELVCIALSLWFGLGVAWAILVPSRKSSPPVADSYAGAGRGSDGEGLSTGSENHIDRFNDQPTAIEDIGRSDAAHSTEDSEIERQVVATTIDLSILANSVPKNSELVWLLLGGISLAIGLSSLDDTNPSLPIAFCLSGALSLAGLCSVRLHLDSATRKIGQGLTILWVAMILVFLASLSSELDIISGIGVALILSPFTLLPGRTLESLATRIKEGKEFLAETAFRIRSRPFGFTSVLAVLSSPAALLVVAGGITLFFFILMYFSENRVNARAQIICLVLTTYIWHLAKRASSIGSFRRRVPRRRFTLYLRPFTDDGARVKSGPWDFYSWALFTPSFDEAIVNSLHPYGSVLAFSDDRFTPTGAIRIQPTAKSKWREEIKDYIDAAECIVVVVGTSAGVVWEMDQVLSSVAREKTVFVFPPEVEEKFQATMEANEDRKTALAKSFLESTGNSPGRPVVLHYQAIVGATIEENDLVWYTAAKPHISGYSIVVSFMLAELRSRSSQMSFK